MKAYKNYFIAILLATFAFGCQGSANPDKDQLISDLKTVFKLLSEEKYEAAADHFRGPEGLSKDKMVRGMKGMIEKNEISMPGIEVLAAKGNFGPLMEVFPERGGSWLERNGISSAENCYGLGFDRAEVAAYWTGSEFQLFRLDDVGKLR